MINPSVFCKNSIMMASCIIIINMKNNKSLYKNQFKHQSPKSWTKESKEIVGKPHHHSSNLWPKIKNPETKWLVPNNPKIAVWWTSTRCSRWVIHQSIHQARSRFRWHLNRNKWVSGRLMAQERPLTVRLVRGKGITNRGKKYLLFRKRESLSVKTSSSMKYFGSSLLKTSTLYTKMRKNTTSRF